ncbi:MAG: radical SAM protein [Candidatus Omnitrophota bacterium]|jgi:MoaA/NifB/PqqE/SkfB family radical SAM enzyme
MAINKPKEALIAITYRCNAKCHMCNTWMHPTRPEEEIRPSDLESLPSVRFCNITGGEPFIREDIKSFVEVMSKKAKRIVISTNGYYTEKIVDLARQYPKIGIRVSMEGLQKANDELRGIKDGFEHGLRTLKELRKMGLKDIGFGITLSDRNILDLMDLHKLSEEMGLEFATAAVHNTYYFHKFDNKITRLDDFDRELEKLITNLLKGGRPKNWFRAYFNYGLLNYAHGNKRLLPCEVGTDLFFIDPFGNVMPCNGVDMSMGNIREKPFNEIWNGGQAEKVREAVRECKKECWMIGSVSPAMKKNIIVPALWVLKNKIMKR